MDGVSSSSTLKRKGSKSDLPPLPSSIAKKPKTSPSSSPVQSASTPPPTDPPPIPSLSERPHSETDLRILQYQNRHLYFHLREKDRRLQEAERRERQWSERCGRWQQQTDTLLSTWDDVVRDVQAATRQVGADEVPTPAELSLPSTRRKPRSSFLRLLTSTPPPPSSVGEGRDDPMDSDGEAGDPAAGDGADDDEQTAVDRVLQTRVSYARDLLASLTSHLVALREENSGLRAMARGEAKEGSDVFLLWEKNEELTKRVDELAHILSASTREGREAHTRAEALHRSLVFQEERLRAVEAERERCEAEWAKAQRRLEKLDMKHKEDVQTIKAEQLRSASSSSSPASSPAASQPPTTSTSLPYADLIDRSSLEAIEEEKRELQQRLTEQTQKAEKRQVELGKMRAELHRREVDLNNLKCEGVAEAAVKESLTYKLVAGELQRKKEEWEVLRATVDKFARELQEKEAGQAKEREGMQREMDRLVRLWQDKEAHTSAELDRLSRAQIRAERDREEAQARYEALAERPAEERRREDDERRRLMEAMERTIKEQELEVRAAREQLSTQERGVQRWVLKVVKMQQRLDERDAQLQRLRQSGGSSAEDAAAVHGLRAQVSALQASIAALHADPELVSTLTESNAALMSELDDLASAHSELNEEHQRLLVAFAELQRDRSQLYSDKLKYKTMETLIKAKCSAHEQSIQALNKESSALQEQIRALDGYKASAEEALRRHEALKAAIERRVLDAQALILATRGELAKVKEERAAQLKAYKERGKLLEDKEVKLAELEKKYHNAKEYYTTTLTQLRALQEKQHSSRAATVNGAGGGGSGSAGEGGGGAQSDAELELSLLKRRMKCSVCSVNDKSVVIGKCWHLFCYDCVDANINSRHRKCPACGVKFDRPDVHTVYGLQG